MMIVSLIVIFLNIIISIESQGMVHKDISMFEINHKGRVEKNSVREKENNCSSRI